MGFYRSNVSASSVKALKEGLDECMQNVTSNKHNGTQYKSC